MCGAGAGGGDAAAEAFLDRTVQVPAQHPLHLWVARYDGFEVLRIVHADPVHVADAGGKWRVMHDDHGRRIGCLGECRS